jgi:hypothetical protein
VRPVVILFCPKTAKNGQESNVANKNKKKKNSDSQANGFLLAIFLFFLSGRFLFRRQSKRRFQRIYQLSGKTL